MKGQPLTPEQKERMAAGRRAAAEKRQKEAAEKAVAAELEQEFAPPRPAPSVPAPEPEKIELPATAGFQGFLASLDDETRSALDDAALLDIWTANIAKATAEKLAAKKKAAAEKALTFARIETGVIPPESAEEIRVKRYNAEMVTWRCDLPEGGGDGHRVDQVVYLNGLWYTTTRAVHDSIRDTAFKAYKAEALFKGEKSSYYDAQRKRWIDPWSGGTPQGTRNYNGR